MRGSPVVMFFLLVFFLFVIYTCVRVAVKGDQDAERAEGDVQGQWFLEPVSAPGP